MRRLRSVGCAAAAARHDLLRHACTRDSLACLLATLGLVLVAFQFQPWTINSHLADFYDYGYIQGFNHVEGSGAQRYRWTTDDAAIAFPGLAAQQAALLVLEAHSDDSARRPPLRLLANGQQLLEQQPAPGWRKLRLLLPPQPGMQLLTRLRLQRQPLVVSDDPRTLGLVVREALVRPVQGAALLLPPWPVGLLLTLVLAGLFVQLRWLGWGRRVAWASWAVASGLVVYMLLQHRAALLIALPRLAGVLALSLLYAALLRRLVPRLQRWSPLFGEPGFARLLVSLAVLSFCFRLVGLWHPQTAIQDEPFHVQRTLLVARGYFLDLYLPNPELTPLPWQTESPITIPYSPLYYALMAPASWLPWPLRLSLAALAVALEAALMPLLAALAAWAGLGPAAALLAGVIYSLLPMSFLTISTGIYPTLFGHWLAFACLAAVPVLPRPLRGRGWWLLVGLLTLALLSYPTVCLFMGLLWPLVCLGLLLAGERQFAWASLRAFVAAALLALLLYYAWHIPALLSGLVPLLREKLAGQAGAGVRAVDAPVLEIVRANIEYALWPWLIPPAFVGLVWLAARPQPRRRLLPILLPWLLIFPLFVGANRWVLLLYKEMFFIGPAVALCVAAALDGLFRLRRWAGLLAAGGMLAVLLVQAAQLWYWAIVWRFSFLK